MQRPEGLVACVAGPQSLGGTQYGSQYGFHSGDGISFQRGFRGIVSLAAVSGGESKRSKVSIRDIREGKTVIVGSLGQPIGEFVKLRGHWSERLKGSDLELDVTHVDGKQLQTPVDFDELFVHSVDKHGHPVAPLKGDKWEIDAYESCGFFHIEPDEFRNRWGNIPTRITSIRGAGSGANSTSS